MAWAVLTIGIGQDSPRASTVWVISMTGMGVLLPDFVDQMKTNWPSPALR